MSAADAASGLRILRGAPDDAELAALVAGMVAVAASGDEDVAPGAPTSAWMDRSRTMHGRRDALPLGRGDGAWRHSLR
ncbi:acyl-CoA carboxylase subunit epsilon [Demequina sp. NBRC 110053]|uniref:acyl-CoA carboxylase subunit epsilon n=1 Tax=Demequina sp. NBRC 110053 TaxID=1570342 RepID=UPI001186C525|nr:acyl-CoA carboxylase subunit epsilon [Demequina sp. NBRC 110053]